MTDEKTNEKTKINMELMSASCRVIDLLNWIFDNGVYDEKVPYGYFEQAQERNDIVDWLDTLELINGDVAFMRFGELMRWFGRDNFTILIASDFETIGHYNSDATMLPPMVIGDCILITSEDTGDTQVIRREGIGDIPEVPDWTMAEIVEDNEREEEG